MNEVIEKYDELYLQIIEEGEAIGLTIPEYVDEKGNKKKGSSPLTIVNEFAKTYNERLQKSEENRLKDRELDIKKEELEIKKIEQNIKKAEEANKTFDIVMRAVVGLAGVKLTKDIWMKVEHLEGLGHMITSTTGKNLLGSLKIFKK
jgi:hypothetical protein